MRPDFHNSQRFKGNLGDRPNKGRNFIFSVWIYTLIFSHSICTAAVVKRRQVFVAAVAAKRIRMRSCCASAPLLCTLRGSSLGGSRNRSSTSGAGGRGRNATAMGSHGRSPGDAGRSQYEKSLARIHHGSCRAFSYLWHEDFSAQESISVAGKTLRAAIICKWLSDLRKSRKNRKGARPCGYFIIFRHLYCGFFLQCGLQERHR